MTTDRRDPSRPEDDVSSADAAADAAREALATAGCESIVTTTSYRTRGTWIVPASTREGDWRVHVDPATSATRVVRADS